MITFTSKTTEPNIYSLLSCTIGGTEQELMASIIKHKKCIVDVSMHSKTSLVLSLSSPDEKAPTFNIDLPKLVPDMKFVEKTTYSFWDCCPRVSHYFKLSKKQGMAQLKEYITKVLQFKGLDNYNIECEMFFTSKARDLYPAWQEVENIKQAA